MYHKPNDMSSNVLLKRIISLLLITLLAQSMARAIQRDARPPSSSSAVIAEVDRLFVYGGDEAREKQAFDVVDRALKETPNDYQMLWRASRSYYYFGDGATGKDREKFFEQGMEAGKRAIAQNADGVEGHFWFASNAA
jgi:hypothetical protein